MRLINVPEVILQPMNIVEKISAQINNMVSGGEKTKETPTKIVKRRSETVEKEKKYFNLSSKMKSRIVSNRAIKIFDKFVVYFTYRSKRPVSIK